VNKVRPEQVALNVNGKVDVSQIDRRGWNVVSEGDFDSPRLARVVRPGEVAMRGLEGVEGVVYSGPLETQPPGRTAPAEALGRRFETVRQASTADVTPIMARRTDLSPEAARELARPGTVEAVVRGSRTTTPAPTVTAAPTTDNAARAAERMALEHALRNARPDAARDLPADRYAGGGGRLTGADRPTGNPFLSRTAREPVAVSGGRIGPSPDGSVGTVRSPMVRPPTSASPSAPSTRSIGAPLGRSPVVSSRPVIVPRTAPTRPTTGVRTPSGYVPRSLSSGRSVPSVSGRSSSSGSGSSVRSAPSSMPRSSSVSRGSSSSSSGGSKSSGAQRKQ